MTQEQAFLTDDILNDNIQSFIHEKGEEPNLITMSLSSYHDLNVIKVVDRHLDPQERFYKNIQIAIDTTLIYHQFKTY